MPSATSFSRRGSTSVLLMIAYRRYVTVWGRITSSVTSQFRKAEESIASCVRWALSYKLSFLATSASNAWASTLPPFSPRWLLSRVMLPPTVVEVNAPYPTVFTPFSSRRMFPATVSSPKAPEVIDFHLGARITIKSPSTVAWLNAPGQKPSRAESASPWPMMRSPPSVVTSPLKASGKTSFTFDSATIRPPWPTVRPLKELPSIPASLLPASCTDTAATFSNAPASIPVSPHVMMLSSPYGWSNSLPSGSAASTAGRGPNAPVSSLASFSQPMSVRDGRTSSPSEVTT
mmetsp:Transcript_159106/g.386438  ORF Transcript_159106/g.386438 Transcript_159106/m.386438 type:complete len:289 (-) Transcript_159106:232-1098(-)